MQGLKPCPCCGETKPLFFYEYPTGAFTVCCGNCGMRGPATGYSKDGAIRTWNALPRRLQWTREKLTRDGFYWCRFRHPNVMHHLVAMVLINAKGRYGVTIGSSDAHDIDSYDDGEWAGPIPEPEDVK